MTESNHRHSDYPIHPMFLDRWSPRAFTGEPVSADTLMTMLEAAHWAPSAGNGQPWRFIHARRDTEAWPVLLDILDDSNQRWAKNAAALVVLVSQTHRISMPSGERRPIYTHAFDTGAAWFALAMQAMQLGLYAHGMGGIDRQKAMTALKIPAEDYRVEAAIAIGRLADKDSLPDDLKAREHPSQRKPLSEVAFEGIFR